MGKFKKNTDCNNFVMKTNSMSEVIAILKFRNLDKI